MPASTNPSVPVSWGELIDKVTILEIKEVRLSSPQAVANVKLELAALADAAKRATEEAGVLNLKRELKAVNETLWEIEDKIRAKEAAKSFDQEFIELARSVYVNNDQRGDIKRRINVAMKSELFEEKQYTTY